MYGFPVKFPVGTTLEGLLVQYVGIDEPRSRFLRHSIVAHAGERQYRM